jgi:hypothetical protein
MGLKLDRGLCAGCLHLPGNHMDDGHCTACGELCSIRQEKVYVASSWRNHGQGIIVYTLRAAGFEVYDFKNPPNGKPFSFDEVGLKGDDPIPADQYLELLWGNDRVVEGFESDFGAMKEADVFVLVLPCGRSAHLELGWAVGAGKRTAILLDDPCTPDLMYRMVDFVAPNVMDLLDWLGVED